MALSSVAAARRAFDREFIGPDESNELNESNESDESDKRPIIWPLTYVRFVCDQIQPSEYISNDFCIVAGRPGP